MLLFCTENYSHINTTTMKFNYTFEEMQTDCLKLHGQWIVTIYHESVNKGLLHGKNVSMWDIPCEVPLLCCLLLITDIPI